MSKLVSDCVWWNISLNKYSQTVQAAIIRKLKKKEIEKTKQTNRQYKRLTNRSTSVSSKDGNVTIGVILIKLGIGKLSKFIFQ